MGNAISVAHYICDEYRRLTGEIIDEMKLQKLLYFSQRESIAVTGEPLFEDEFEAWRYGPVCVPVRNRFRRGQIEGIDFDRISEAESYIIDNIILQYGELASWRLSQLSHEEISWQNARRSRFSDEKGKSSLRLEDIRKDAEKIRPYDSIWDMYLDEFDDYEETYLEALSKVEEFQTMLINKAL